MYIGETFLWEKCVQKCFHAVQKKEHPTRGLMYQDLLVLFMASINSIY